MAAIIGDAGLCAIRCAGNLCKNKVKWSERALLERKASHGCADEDRVAHGGLRAWHCPLSCGLKVARL